MVAEVAANYTFYDMLIIIGCKSNHRMHSAPVPTLPERMHVVTMQENPQGPLLELTLLLLLLFLSLLVLLLLLDSERGVAHRGPQHEIFSALPCLLLEPRAIQISELGKHNYNYNGALDARTRTEPRKLCEKPCWRVSCVWKSSRFCHAVKNDISSIIMRLPRRRPK